jgi:hypothetical protein
MATRPTTLNAFTGEEIPAYLRRGTNPFTNNLNDPLEQAQHNFAGPGPAALTAALRRQGLSFGSLGRGGGSTVAGKGPSLASFGGGDDDAAHAIAINDYLAGLTDSRAAAYEQEQAADAAGRDRSTVQRAAAIANQPNVSQNGRPIVQNPDGSYETAAPTGAPVNRQALAAQMAPGLIAPPAPDKPVTFGNPEPAMVNGKRVFVRAGSDGLTYDMGRRQIDAATIQPPDDKNAPPKPMAVPVDASGEPITGDTLLKTLPSSKQKLVTAILEGRQAIPSGTALKDPYWKDLLETANAVDPNFDTVNFNARANTRKDFTSGRGAQQINAINTVVGHLHDLADTGEKLGNTGLNWVNRVYNQLTPGGTSRGVALNNFETLKEGVSTELMRTWRQVGAGSEKEIEDWKAQLEATKSPEELRGAFKTIGGMLESKLSALDSQYQQGMGTDKVTAISPESRKRLDALQGITGVAASGGGTVKLRAPDGSVQEVPAAQADHYIGLGAKRVGG